MTISSLSELSASEQSQVRQLATAAQAADGTAPLSEQFLLNLRAGSRAIHYLARSVSRDRSLLDRSVLAGYAQLAPAASDEPPAAELVVAPDVRQRGIGSQLLAELPRQLRLWAHGDLPAAEGFAKARGLEAVRELLRMTRAVGPDGPGLDEPVLPDDLAARPFEPGRDELAWLTANAAAFAHHPEQGSLTLEDLEQREAQPWFDPDGFILVVPRADPDDVAAFHWTKIHPAGELGTEAVGEVYVLGVHPAHQGRGLSRRLTLLGLHRLRGQGVRTVQLYADGDNTAALRTYRGLGFEVAGVDRMYSRAVRPGVQR